MYYSRGCCTVRRAKESLVNYPLSLCVSIWTATQNSRTHKHVQIVTTSDFLLTWHARVLATILESSVFFLTFSAQNGSLSYRSKFIRPTCTETRIIMRSALLWNVTPRTVIILYRCFGKTYRSHLQDFLPLEVGTDRLSLNVGKALPLPEERRYYLRGDEAWNHAQHSVRLYKHPNLLITMLLYLHHSGKTQ
jgi:hypothetical protein